MRELRRYEVHGVPLQVYDEASSLASDWVASELQADHYHLRGMAFDQGDIVIDIGAHVGLFAMYLAKRWPALTVLAFEPFPENFRNCADNLRLNELSNVLLSPKAVANDSCLLNMATDPRNSGGASALVRTFQSNGIVGDIATTTFDEIFSAHGIDRCKLLKIDCEGMEYEILLGGAPVFDKIEYLVGEFHASPSLQERGWYPQKLYAHCTKFFHHSKMAIMFNTIPG